VTRGPQPGQGVRHSLAEGLPASFLQDDFILQLVGAFDEVLAPVLATLDNQYAYFDPWLAPDDFLPWLATWLGLSVDERWPPESRRRLVANAHEIYRWRGTRRGVVEAVWAYAGVEPEVEENGALAWSPVPGGTPPGDRVPRLVVRVPRDGADLDLGVLERLVAAAVPAHLPHHVELLG
jgi:phage tail-like protein